MRFDGGINLLFHLVLSSLIFDIAKVDFVTGTPVIVRRTKKRQDFLLTDFLASDGRISPKTRPPMYAKDLPRRANHLASFSEKPIHPKARSSRNLTRAPASIASLRYGRGLALGVALSVGVGVGVGVPHGTVTAISPRVSSSKTAIARSYVAFASSCELLTAVRPVLPSSPKANTTPLWRV